jgi:hypothetical protein
MVWNDVVSAPRFQNTNRVSSVEGAVLSAGFKATAQA